MKLEIETFKTVDGGDTIAIQPAGSRRQKPSWYVWMKSDGHGILVIDSQTKRIELPANQNRDGSDVVCDHDLTPCDENNDHHCRKCGKDFRYVAGKKQRD
jgi:hypothetical protein